MVPVAGGTALSLVVSAAVSAPACGAHEPRGGRRLLPTQVRGAEGRWAEGDRLLPACPGFPGVS